MKTYRAGKGRERGYLLVASGMIAFAVSNMEVSHAFVFMALTLAAVWAAAALYRGKRRSGNPGKRDALYYQRR